MRYTEETSFNFSSKRRTRVFNEHFIKNESLKFDQLEPCFGRVKNKNAFFLEKKKNRFLSQIART